MQYQLVLQRVLAGDTIQRISGLCKLWVLLHILHSHLLRLLMQRSAVEA